MRKLSLYSWLFRCYWSSQLVRDWSTTQERIKHKGSWAYKKVYYISFSKKLKTRWHDDEVCYNWNTILGYICLANDIQHTPNLNKDILHNSRTLGSRYLFILLQNPLDKFAIFIPLLGIFHVCEVSVYVYSKVPWQRDHVKSYWFFNFPQKLPRNP